MTHTSSEVPAPTPSSTGEPLAAPAEGEFQQLHPRVVTVWRLSTAIRVALWAALTIASYVIMPFPAYMGPVRVATVFWGLIALLVGWLVISTLLYTPARWRAWTYREGTADVRLREGVLWRKESVVPHMRIQHVDTTHGPIERALGLASVIIFTAGSHGVLTIPGLALADAEALRDRLAALGGTDDAV